MRIAFFDSGIGGLTVLKRALELLPDETYLYYADTRHVPYGVRPKEEVLAYTLEAADFLAAQRIDALVVACNTATAVAIGELRKRFSFPVIGMEPAVKPALARNTGKKILVFATTLTLRESKLEALISALDTNRRVERHELDGLVTFAEALDFDSPLVWDYLQEKLTPICWDAYETAVLGCTHFLYYRDALRALIGDRVTLIDGNDGTARRLAALIGKTTPPSRAPAAPPRLTFYASGVEESPERALLLLGAIHLQQN